MQKKAIKSIKHKKRYISITKESDTPITVSNHALSLTVLYLMGMKYQSTISQTS